MKWAPYQLAWLQDPAPRKAYVKSRRIGISEAVSFEIACAAIGLDISKTPAARVRGTPQAILSAGQDQSRDLLARVVLHLEAFEKVGICRGMLPPANKRGELRVRLFTGVELRAFANNPGTVRSFEGDVTIDEAGSIPRADALWAAAKPLADATHRRPQGYKIRVVGTPLGDDNLFYQICEGRLRDTFSQHRTTIHEAIADGFPVRGGIEALREEVGDPDAFAQEYECSFMSANLRYISAEAYDRALYDAEARPAGSSIMFGGMDVARKKHNSAIVTAAKHGDTLYHLGTEARRDVPWDEQEAWAEEVVPGCQRFAVDSTGLGSQFAERLHARYGSRLEPVTFTAPVKEALASGLKLAFERGRIRMLRDDTRTRRDVLTMRRQVTEAGNVRIDVRETEDGHADRAWALALAVHAAGGMLRDPLAMPTKTGDLSRKGRLARRPSRGAWR